MEKNEASAGFAMHAGHMGPDPDRWTIWRSFLSFDLSEIPAGKTIVSCTLTVYNVEPPFLPAGTDNVLVQEGTQSDDLAVEDYNAFAGSLHGPTAWVENENSLVFGAAGLAYIESVFGAMAKLCLREYNHDYLNHIPIDEKFYAGLHYSESATESKRPTLTITYE